MFRDDFLWGGAVAAHQCEVANLEAAGSAVNTETNKINFGFWEIGTFMKIYQIFGHPRKGCKNFCCYFFY